MKQLHFSTLYSTNGYLLDNYKDLENFTLVSADVQTKARGRKDRKWDSEKGNLYFSLLIKNKEFFDNYKGLSIVCAYSILEVIKEYVSGEVMIKWPNDVLIDGKKVCGVLLESISTNDIECIVIGIGLNVNQENFSKDYLIEATSLRNIVKSELDIKEIKAKIFTQLFSNYDKLINGFNYVELINKYNYLLNKNACVLIENKKQMVTVKSINQDYSLSVELNGNTIDIDSDEVTFHI